MSQFLAQFLVWLKGGLILGLTVLILGSVVFYFACAAFTIINFKTTKAPDFKKATQKHPFLNTHHPDLNAPNQAHHSPPNLVSNLVNDLADREPNLALNQAAISLLIPICGLDANAWENWTAFCQQDYPEYEVLFGVKDQNDPAIPVLQQIIEQFPQRAHLFTNLAPCGINHKDSNLTYLLEVSKHDLLVFADSDIQVNSSYLEVVTQPLRSHTAEVVTCAYLERRPVSFGAALAALGRCCDFIPSLFLARALDGKVQFAIGKTIALHRQTLAAIGGLPTNRIGSDYYLGHTAAKAGFKVVLSPLVLNLKSGAVRLKSVLLRELRWSRTIRFNRGAQYYTMVFCYGLVYLPLLVSLTQGAAWTITLAGVTITIRFLQALIAIHYTRSPHLYRWLWVLPYRDCLSFGIWLMGAFGNQVEWRGRRLQIQGNGVIVPIK